MDVGADGLKTGNIGESGFGLVGSAVQNGQRLVVVVNGSKTAKDRAEEARRILNWGFRSFEVKEVFPAGAAIGEAKVFGGEPASVNLVAKGPVRILVPRGSNDRVVAKVIYQGPLRAPVASGAQVGKLLIQRGQVQVLDLPLYVEGDSRAWASHQARLRCRQRARSSASCVAASRNPGHDRRPRKAASSRSRAGRAQASPRRSAIS